jgi:DNA-binding GntR family transcriptional regulator
MDLIMALAFRTKNVAVYEELRQDIIDGKLKPGQKIIMSEIAKKYGLSEIPVREAVRRLESDGFVNFTPHVGAVVTEIDEKEFIEIYLIRIELEALATRLAVPYVSDKDVEYLTRINQEMETAIEKKSYEKLGNLNRKFHLRIYQSAPYPYLNNMLRDLWEKAERTQSVFAYVPERAEASVKEHINIINALKKKDAELAEKLVKSQKNKTMEALQLFAKKEK